MTFFCLFFFLVSLLEVAFHWIAGAARHQSHRRWPARTLFDGAIYRFTRQLFGNYGFCFLVCFFLFLNRSRWEILSSKCCCNFSFVSVYFKEYVEFTNSLDGTLVLKKALDFESAPRLSVEIRAQVVIAHPPSPIFNKHYSLACVPVVNSLAASAPVLMRWYIF